MRNSRSTKFVAWLLTLIMVFNMTPVSAVATSIDPDPAEDETNLSHFFEETYDLSEVASEPEIVSSGIGQKIHLSFDLSGDANLQTVDGLGMIYPLQEGQVPLATKGSDGNISWEYDSENHQLVFTAKNGEIREFTMK